MIASKYFHGLRANCLFTTLNQGLTWKLGIYKGTMPILTDISAGFSTVATSRSSDLLLECTYTGLTNTFGRTDSNYLRLFMQVTPVLTTKADGTATWFSLYATSGTAYQQKLAMLGAVSDTSGTAPLKLDSATILSANSYEIASFAFTMGN